MLLGRKWSYITPEYLYEEVDMPDVRDYMAFIPQKEREWAYRSRRNDYSKIRKAGKVKVVTGGR